MNKIKCDQEFVFLLILETFRFYDMENYENDIFSTLIDARAWTQLFLAGKSDSTTAFSQNVVVTETHHAGQERA